MVIEVKSLQPAKQSTPNEVTDEGMVIEVKPLQKQKQNSPKEVTEEGMVMEVKPLHPLKQSTPNEVTLYSTPSLLLTFSVTIIPLPSEICRLLHVVNTVYLCPQKKE